MAKVKNQDIPLYVDVDPTDDQAEPFPNKYRTALKEASPKKGLPEDTGIVTKTTRGRRRATRTKKIKGQWVDPAFLAGVFDPLSVNDAMLFAAHGSVTRSRIIFKKATDMWNHLSAEEKQCWYDKNKEDGIKCSTFDLFIKCQLKAFNKNGQWDTHTCKVCSQPVILFVSQTMTPGQTQTLTLQNLRWKPFVWSIFSGGGSLSSTVGNSITFTAPASNAKCKNSTILSVTDQCGKTTFLKISTNAAGGGERAFIITKVHCWNHMPAPATYEGISSWGPYCFACFCHEYDCQGNYLRTGMTSSMWTDSANNPAPLWCNQYCGGDSQVLDTRNGSQIQAGCCPAALP
jgi:hypothetical protein